MTVIQALQNFGIIEGSGGSGGGLTYTTTIPGAPGTLNPSSPIIIDGGPGTTGNAYTISFSSPGQIEVKAWGAGAGNHSTPGGAGGSAIATVDVTSGVTYTVFAGGAGTPSSGRGSSGGGAGSGFIIASPLTKIVVAGGGGGSTGRNGGAGGGSDGQNAPPVGAGGYGGTQVAAGAGGSSSRRTGAAGSGTNGGGGNTGGSPFFPGGTSGVPGQFLGGTGCTNGGDQGSGGGGGGHFGGGEGGGDTGGFGGGGGSGYYNPTYCPTGTLYQGNLGTAGNSSDPQRSTAGDPATAGRVVINAIS